VPRGLRCRQRLARKSRCAANRSKFVRTVAWRWPTRLIIPPSRPISASSGASPFSGIERRPDNPQPAVPFDEDRQAGLRLNPGDSVPLLALVLDPDTSNKHLSQDHYLRSHYEPRSDVSARPTQCVCADRCRTAWRSFDSVNREREGGDRKRHLIQARFREPLGRTMVDPDTACD